MIALSWSRLSTYMQCPRQFHLKFISKTFREEEKSVHLIKGEELHKQLENYVLARNGQATMPVGFTPAVRDTLPYVDRLFTLYDALYPEAQLAANTRWEPTDWFGPDTAWRAIWDVTGVKSQTCFIGDYKSGRIYPYGDTYGQLHLSAVLALNRFQDVPEVTAAYIYIEHKKIEPLRVTRKPSDEVDSKGRPIPHLAPVQEYFEKWFERVQFEKNWDPVANDNCKYCQATRAQCSYSRKL